MELRGKWREDSGREVTGPEDTGREDTGREDTGQHQPSWPAPKDALGSGPEPSEGSASHWWPEPGVGTGESSERSGWGPPSQSSGGVVRFWVIRDF